MPESFRVVGFARREKTDASWRAEMREGLERYSRTKTVDDAQWEQFAANLAYHQGDLTDAEAYAGLAARLTEYGDERLANNLVFYLAISPSLFGEVVDQLHAATLLRRWEEGDSFWQRVVVEKPFGHDLQSARLLNNHLLRHARERQIFRIDHYLGKETVQNIMMFRFSNAIFEQLWSREAIEHVQNHRQRNRRRGQSRWIFRGSGHNAGHDAESFAANPVAGGHGASAFFGCGGCAR